MLVRGFGATHDRKAPPAEFEVKEGRIVARVRPEVTVGRGQTVGAGDGGVEGFCGERWG